MELINERAKLNQVWFLRIVYFLLYCTCSKV